MRWYMLLSTHFFINYFPIFSLFTILFRNFARKLMKPLFYINAWQM